MTSTLDRAVRVSGSTPTDRVARTRLYRAGRLDKEDFPVDDISDYLDEPDTVLWVDLCAPDRKDLAIVADELGLHALAVEDAIQPKQRPKLDRYETHEFMSLYGVHLDHDSGNLRLSELSAFITSRVLVTVRKDESFDMDGVLARWDGSPDLAKNGVGFLLWGLIDHVVDGHFDAVQTLDEEIEELEDLLFDDQPRDKDVQRRSFALRKSLVTLRRVVLPMREVVNTLMRRDIEGAELPWCEANDVGVLAYGPLAHGLLTGKMSPATTFAPDDWRRDSELFADDAFPERIAVADELQRIADASGRAGGVAELAVAWVLRRPEVTSAIIGARDAAQATANAKLAARPLADDEAAAIEDVLARHPAASRHYGHGEPPDRSD